MSLDGRIEALLNNLGVQFAQKTNGGAGGAVVEDTPSIFSAPEAEAKNLSIDERIQEQTQYAKENGEYNLSDEEKELYTSFNKAIEGLEGKERQEAIAGFINELDEDCIDEFLVAYGAFNGSNEESILVDLFNEFAAGGFSHDDYKLSFALMKIAGSLSDSDKEKVMEFLKDSDAMDFQLEAMDAVLGGSLQAAEDIYKEWHS